MPKKQNITSDAVAEVARQCDDIYFDLGNMAEEIRAGRCDEIDNPVEYARKFAALARTAADAATVVLVKAGMQQDRDNLRRELEARVAGRA